MDIPPRLPPLKHQKALGDWLNQLRDYAVMQSPMITTGQRTSRTAVGTFLQPIPEEVIGVSQFRIKDWSNDDYLICRPWNGKVEDDTLVYIAKSYYLRRGVFDGVEIEIEVESLDESEELQTETRTLSYAYHSATFRTVTDVDDETTETQTIIPRFLEDDVIMAAPSSEVAVVRNFGSEESPQFEALQWVDLNCDARAWMKSS